MYGIRDHKLYRIKYRSHLPIRRSEPGGETEYVGHEKGWTEQMDLVIASSKDVAVAWFMDRHKYSIDSKDDQLEFDPNEIVVERIEAVLLTFTY